MLTFAILRVISRRTIARPVRACELARTIFATALPWRPMSNGNKPNVVRSELEHQQAACQKHSSTTTGVGRWQELAALDAASDAAGINACRTTTRALHKATHSPRPTRCALKRVDTAFVTMTGKPSGDLRYPPPVEIAQLGGSSRVCMTAQRRAV